MRKYEPSSLRFSARARLGNTFERGFKRARKSWRRRIQSLTRSSRDHTWRRYFGIHHTWHHVRSPPYSKTTRHRQIESIRKKSQTQCWRHENISRNWNSYVSYCVRSNSIWKVTQHPRNNNRYESRSNIPRDWTCRQAAHFQDTLESSRRACFVSFRDRSIAWEHDHVHRGEWSRSASLKIHDKHVFVIELESVARCDSICTSAQNKDKEQKEQKEKERKHGRRVERCWCVHSKGIHRTSWYSERYAHKNSSESCKRS